MHALVTGASGTVGRALCAYLGAHGHRATPWDRTAAPPDDYAAMQRLVRQHRPDVLVHLAIASQPTGRADEAALVNVHWPGELAWLCREEGLRFVFTSTVMVFSDDATGPFSVASRPDAATGYGAQKRDAEERVFAQNPEARIVRLGWQIADAPSDGGNHMAAWMAREATAHGQVEASTRWLPATSHVADTAAALVQVAGQRPGLYHADANEGWTFYDLACALAAHHGQGWAVRPTAGFVFDQRLLDPRLRLPPLGARLPGLAHPFGKTSFGPDSPP